MGHLVVGTVNVQRKLFAALDYSLDGLDSMLIADVWCLQEIVLSGEMKERTERIVERNVGKGTARLWSRHGIAVEGSLVLLRSPGDGHATSCVTRRGTVQYINQDKVFRCRVVSSHLPSSVSHGEEDIDISCRSWGELAAASRRCMVITGMDANMMLDRAAAGVCGGALAATSARAETLTGSSSTAASASASSSSPTGPPPPSSMATAASTASLIEEARQADQKSLNTYEDWWGKESDLTSTATPAARTTWAGQLFGRGVRAAIDS